MVRNVHWSRASVCLSVCPLPYAHTTAWTQMWLKGIVGGAPYLCTMGQICNRCTVALLVRHNVWLWMSTLLCTDVDVVCDNIARTQNVTECLYSLYAWFLYVVDSVLWVSVNAITLLCMTGGPQAHNYYYYIKRWCLGWHYHAQNVAGPPNKH